MNQRVKSHFKKVDPKLFAYIDKDIRVLSTDTKNKTSHTLFVSLTRIVVGQQLSGKAADSIFKRFEKAFPQKRITVKNILEMTEHDLRALGMSYAKARALLDYAQKYKNKEISFKNIGQKTDAEIKEMLLSIKGVGPWTCDMFLMFSLHREDIFSPKDLGLQKGIQKIYSLKEKPDEKKALEISKKWAPFRTYASLILWHSVDTSK